MAHSLFAQTHRPGTLRIPPRTYHKFPSQTVPHLANLSTRLFDPGEDSARLVRNPSRGEADVPRREGVHKLVQFGDGHRIKKYISRQTEPGNEFHFSLSIFSLESSVSWERLSASRFSVFIPFLLSSHVLTIPHEGSFAD
jgi:hypothetical protein